jgi:tetratricopeptide (TPR) repeat protein
MAPAPAARAASTSNAAGSRAGASPFAVEGMSLLSYVLERVPKGQYKNLPFNNLPPEELGHVASQWLDQDRIEEAVALLQPLLADPAKLDARHEYAFDMLCDAYLELGQPVKRMRLAESVMQTPDRALKSAAMHRRCTMLADNGEYLAAWKLFKEAQRIDPDGDGVDPWADTEWQDWLAEHPLAWDSFAILEDLVISTDYAVFDDDELEGQLDAFVEALLARALVLLRLNLRKYGADACKLEWGWIENRPALRAA